jgi:hypothetical protein
MKPIGRSKLRKAKAEKLEPTPEEEYEVVADEHARLRAQIRDLEGFIDVAPEIREQRIQETRVTLPPPEDSMAAIERGACADLGEDDAECGEDLQERYGRRHLAAMKRARRRNFCVFLLSAAAVAAFLCWVSKVVQ